MSNPEFGRGQTPSCLVIARTAQPTAEIHLIRLDCFVSAQGGILAMTEQILGRVPSPMALRVRGLCGRYRAKPRFALSFSKFFLLVEPA